MRSTVPLSTKKMFSSKDSWMSDYDSLVELGARIGMRIRERDQHSFGSSQHNQLNSSVQRTLQEYQQKLQSLKGSLHRLSSTRSVSDYEYERRKAITEELSSKYQQLEKACGTTWADERQSYNGTGADPWGAGPSRGPGSAHRMSTDEVRAQQQMMIEEQDQGLEELSKALRKQQHMGLAIQDEVEQHNVIIDDIHDATTRADQRVRAQTRRVEIVRKKDSSWCTCMLWTIIIVLAILIIVVAVIPKPK